MRPIAKLFCEDCDKPIESCTCDDYNSDEDPDFQRDVAKDLGLVI